MGNLRLQSPPKKKHPEIWPFSVSTNQHALHQRHPFWTEFFPSRNKIWNQVIHLPTAGKKLWTDFLLVRSAGCWVTKIHVLLTNKINRPTTKHSCFFSGIFLCLCSIHMIWMICRKVTLSDFGRNENHHLKANTLGRRYCYVMLFDLFRRRVFKVRAFLTRTTRTSDKKILSSFFFITFHQRWISSSIFTPFSKYHSKYHQNFPEMWSPFSKQLS